MFYKNIILAIDGSDISNTVIEKIIEQTQGEDSNVRLIYVIDESYLFNTEAIINNPQFISSLRKNGQSILDKAKEMIENHTSLKVETFLFELKPFQRIAEIIVDAANKWPADLIIIGSHGRKGMSHILLGSVAENVIRLATIPVLIIR